MQGVAAETVNYRPPARRFDLSADEPLMEAAACRGCPAIVCSTLLAKAGMERVEGAAATQGPIWPSARCCNGYSSDKSISISSRIRCKTNGYSGLFVQFAWMFR
jgi:hypothetical protein